MSSKTYPIIERLADEVIVTARSTVDAQQAASDAMGGDCTIVSVERIHEGGIGGFFATELVRVTARPSRFHRADRELDAAMTSAEELVSSLRRSSPQFADRLMSELLHHQPDPPQVEQRVVPPAEPPVPVALPVALPVAPAVQPPVVQPPVVTAPATPPSPRPDVVADRAPAAHADPRWSHHTLRALGLPDRIVDLALREQPHGAQQWIMALMGALRTICTPPPVGPTVLIGPACANLARQLRLVSVGADELSESISSVAIANVSTGIARASLNDRAVHIVVGGSWQHLGSIRPHVVSAATEADLLETVRVCCAWDATLGWAPIGDRYERIDEFTLVSHVRSILYGIDRPTAGVGATTSTVAAEPMLATFS